MYIYDNPAYVTLRPFAYIFLQLGKMGQKKRSKPEDHWSCIAHLSVEDMLKSAVIEEKKFKHSPRVGADNPTEPKF